MQDYYIIRNISVNAKYPLRLIIWSLVSIFACLEFNNIHILNQYVITSLLLGVEEFYLVTKSVRVGKISDGNIFLNSILRGITEGGVFVLVPGFFNSIYRHFMPFNTLSIFLLFYITFISKPKTLNVASTRKMNGMDSILFIGFLLVFFGYHYQQYLSQILIIGFVSYSWNLFAYFMNMRWISNQKNGMKTKSEVVQTLGLLYNAYFEMGLIYTSFIIVADYTSYWLKS